MIAHKRLARELMALQKEPPALIHARPLESNILHFHYVLEGPPGTPYAGGVFRVKLTLGNDFPSAPPKGARARATPTRRTQRIEH